MSRRYRILQHVLNYSEYGKSHELQYDVEGAESTAKDQGHTRCDLSCCQCVLPHRGVLWVPYVHGRGSQLPVSLERSLSMPTVALYGISKVSIVPLDRIVPKCHSHASLLTNKTEK